MVGVRGNVFIEPCQLHLMLFIIPLIYGEQFKTKLQWLNAFYSLSERLTCNFGGITAEWREDGRQRVDLSGPVRYMSCVCQHASSTWSRDFESWISLGLNGESEGLSNNAPRVICLLLSGLMFISLLTLSSQLIHLGTLSRPIRGQRCSSIDQSEPGMMTLSKCPSYSHLI